MIDMNKPWAFRAGEKIFGFDPGSELFKEGSCMVEMKVEPDGTMTVTHIKNWRADEKAQPFQTIYRARPDDYVRSDLADFLRVGRSIDSDPGDASD